MMRVRTVPLLLLSVAVFVAIWIGAAGECGPGAGCIATARVEGRTYSVGIARTMIVPAADLLRYAAVTGRTGGFETVDAFAYRLGTADPTRVLVMKLVPGQVDGAGSIGAFLLLAADETGRALACPYFSPGDPLSGCP